MGPLTRKEFLETRFRDAASWTYNAIGGDVPGLEYGLSDEDFVEIIRDHIHTFGELTDDELREFRALSAEDRHRIIVSVR